MRSTSGYILYEFRPSEVLYSKRAALGVITRRGKFYRAIMDSVGVIRGFRTKKLAESEL